MYLRFKSAQMQSRILTETTELYVRCVHRVYMSDTMKTSY